MNIDEVMAALKGFGDEGIKKILMKHGVKEPLFGVKVEHLKTIQKKVKMDHQLALGLYATGNADAMYLAGLVADDGKMTREDLRLWARQAVSNNISEYTVPWVAAGGHYGMELGLEWIDAAEEHIAATGWATLSNLVAFLPDEKLDIPALKGLLERVERDIHSAANRVRYTMNGFVIAVGAYVAALSEDAGATAGKIGKVTVEMNGTACKVPDAEAYIAKVLDKSDVGKKKKKLKC